MGCRRWSENSSGRCLQIKFIFLWTSLVHGELSDQWKGAKVILSKSLKGRPHYQDVESDLIAVYAVQDTRDSDWKTWRATERLKLAEPSVVKSCVECGAWSSEHQDQIARTVNSLVTTLCLGYKPPRGGKFYPIPCICSRFGLVMKSCWILR
jgi:hypothetical protein